MSKVYVPMREPIWWNDVPSGGYDRIVRTSVPVRYTITPPLRKLTVRPIAVIEAEIRRATVPALRAEDV